MNADEILAFSRILLPSEKYAGKGVITVFNALSPEEDAYTVWYGVQAVVTKEFALDFRIDKKTDEMVPVWAISPLEDRDYDGTATLQFKTQLSEVRGVFQNAEDWPWLVGSPGIEFEDGSEIAMLYVDGGYVSLTLQKHWQIPAPFKGTLIGIPTGGSQPTQKPAQQNAQPTQRPQGGNPTNPPNRVTDPPERVTDPPVYTHPTDPPGNQATPLNPDNPPGGSYPTRRPGWDQDWTPGEYDLDGSIIDKIDLDTLFVWLCKSLTHKIRWWTC